MVLSIRWELGRKKELRFYWLGGVLFCCVVVAAAVSHLS
jgi:hypothetical protein